MIIGGGDIGSVLKDREGVCFFCSGVSNSSTQDLSLFVRERILLMKQPKYQCLFYFSTLSQYFSETTPYISHKLSIERMIKDNWTRYVILRIGNITWGLNPNTFLNKLRSLKAQGIPFPIHDEWKYMITKEDLLMLTQNLPINTKCEVSAFSYSKKVIDLI